MPVSDMASEGCHRLAGGTEDGLLSEQNRPCCQKDEEAASSGSIAAVLVCEPKSAHPAEAAGPGNKAAIEPLPMLQAADGGEAPPLRPLGLGVCCAALVWLREKPVTSKAQSVLGRQPLGIFGRQAPAVSSWPQRYRSSGVKSYFRFKNDSAAESFNGNETVGQSSTASGGTHSREMGDSNEDGKTVLEQDQQPLNLSDSPLSAQLTSEYRLDDPSSDGKNKYKPLLISDLKMEQEARENGSKSPAHSYSSYDSSKHEGGERGAEDLSLHRGDEDDEDHEDHDDAEKVAETDGVEAERLKAFNMFVRLFVDENLDRMVPISKQPKEKIQAIIDSCRRQFPEYQERARKRIRTYLKSCRRMKRSGFEMSRPIPSHLTSAVAESILASACESESRNAAKRMRLEKQQDKSAPADKQSKPEAAPATHAASAVSGSQEVLYINGNGTYSYHSYRGLGGGLLSLSDASSSGPTDLSMKRQLAPSSGSSSSSSSRPQLSPTEINAVRQLVAGYRESAAFLLRSADELENLILQQN
ncbi:Nucleolar protein 4 [Myotis brandtii]|uniref:Nucleolar protein 4 n=1 Tax=Myotis brandtii TaxID=109478 RepID=S7PG78_MYOBR|nr:Nucleolar protein 4 [Myotis brandtii]